VTLPKFLRFFSFGIALISALPGHFSYAETTKMAAAARPIAIFSSTDSSGLNIAGPLQQALGALFEDTKAFKATLVQDSLAGFSEVELEKAFRKYDTEVISFLYLEQQRISVFLFDAYRKGQFIVSTQPVSITSANSVTQAMIETQFRRAFNTMMEQYNIGRFQPLPSTQQAEADAKKEPPKELTREEKARLLFKELAVLQEGPIYVGVNLGMARFAAKNNAASTVNIGGFAGARLSDSFRVELGASIFSYLLLQMDWKYRIPFGEHYLSVYLDGSIGQVAAVVTQNRGFNSANLKTGQFLFGPGLSFEVPLLGASIRGEVRWLFGQANILMGTYGVSYSL
jgi:hypothetical protein